MLAWTIPSRDIWRHSQSTEIHRKLGFCWQKHFLYFLYLTYGLYLSRLGRVQKQVFQLCSRCSRCSVGNIIQSSCWIFLSPNEITEITEIFAMAKSLVQVHFLYFCGTYYSNFLLAIFKSQRNNRNTQKDFSLAKNKVHTLFISFISFISVGHIIQTSC